MPLPVNILGALCIVLCTSSQLFGYQTDVSSQRELINFMVGGVWVSENVDNSGVDEDFKSFFMNFENWHDENSVRGSIYGVKNNSDTTSLMEVWNFVDPSQNSIRLIQRTTWQEHSEGTITLHQGKHLDIRFKSTTADGQEYYTRDIHYKESPNQLRAETFQRNSENEDWRKIGESIWIRKEWN